MPPSPHLPHRRRALLVVLALLATLGPGLAAPASAQGDVEDPNLDQAIDPDQAVVAGAAELAAGHVDVGPRFVDGDLTLLVHDDTVVSSVWRSLDEVVLRVGDEALQTVPDDPTYAFLGAEPGAEVHIVPQVERPGVVWVGWNTQDPEVMEAVDRGATLTLLGVDGPGTVTVYLQSGALGDPEVLWTSTEAERQSIWVEVNTHTHANWVFTEPGVYLVQVEISADAVGGEALSDVRTLRFAVGDAAATEEALEATFTAPVAPVASDEPEPEGAEGDGGEGGGVAVPAVVLVVAAVVLVAAVVAVVVRGGRARRRAEAERRATATDDPVTGDPASDDPAPSGRP